MYLQIQVLHAEADPVEAQFAEQPHGAPVGLARIDLDGIVTAVVVGQGEVVAQVGHQFAQLQRIEKGRGAAAQVQLFHPLPSIQVPAGEGHLLAQGRKVGDAAAAVLGDDLVAGAVVADVGAEGHMQVERQRASGLAAQAQGAEQVEGADAVVELHGGGVGGVAGAGAIIAGDEVGVPGEGGCHAGLQWFRGDQCEGHGPSFIDPDQ
ncbi:hypothetical protein Q3H58_000039 [Pseudomonas psychrotolerans]|nr:hypothetical protein [Pseudomonas psychrotolerans]